MAEIKEQAIYDDLITKLKTILIANEYASGKNYETDIGNSVKEWQLVPEHTLIDTDALIVEDRKREYAEKPENNSWHEGSHFYHIKLFSSNGANTASALRKGERDIRRCIGANHSFFRDKYIDIAFFILSQEKLITRDDRILAGSETIIRIEFTSEKFLINEPEF